MSKKLSSMICERACGCWNEKRPGTYRCAVCGTELLRSEEKYNSGSAWPSFFDPIDVSRLSLIEDKRHGMVDAANSRSPRC